MSYGIYIQVFVDLLLVGALTWLLVDRRGSQPDVQEELTVLTDTLGELLVEVGRMTDRTSVPDAAPLAKASEVKPTVRSAPSRGEEGKPLVDQVLQLADQGLGLDDIARQVGRPVGEVSLVLGLRASRVAVGA